MSGDDERSFLRRWSERKLTRVDEALPVETPAPAEAAAVPELPPIESLTADSDYTQFLQPGVPDVLRVASLRRAWVTDPAITGHKTMADYDWDFNAPGYGALRPGDDVRKLADAILNPPPVQQIDEKPTPQPAESPPQAIEVAMEETPVAPASDAAEPVQATPSRRHGSALPD